MPPFVVGREGLDAQLAGERRDPLLGRTDPLAADLDHLALADLLVEQPAADPVTRLDHDRLRSGGEETTGGDETGEPGPDDRDVGLNRVASASLPGALHRNETSSAAQNDSLQSDATIVALS